MKRAAQLTVALVSSALFLWLAFRAVDVEALPELLAQLRLPYVGAYVLALCFIQVCRAWRWQLLVRELSPLDFAVAFRVSNLGLLMTTLLPLRLGELARPILLRRETGASLAAGMGAVVVERAADGLLVTALFFASAMAIGGAGEVSPGLRTAGLVAFSLFGVATLVIVLALRVHLSVGRLIERALRPVSQRLASRLATLADNFVSGLRTVSGPRAAALLGASTVAYWAANGLGLWAVMRGFGWDLPLAAGFVLVSILVIGIMIPAGPGFLGTYQGALLAGLSVFGLGANEAAAFGLVVYPINMAVVVAFGLPTLLRPAVNRQASLAG